MPIHPKILNLPERQSSATSELVFMSTLDPLGISSYLIAKTNTGLFTLVAMHVHWH